MTPVLVIPEGVESSDGRSYPPGILTWRDRYEFMFTDERTEGHVGSVPRGEPDQPPSADRRRGHLDSRRFGI